MQLPTCRCRCCSRRRRRRSMHCSAIRRVENKILSMLFMGGAQCVVELRYIRRPLVIARMLPLLCEPCAECIMTFVTRRNFQRAPSNRPRYPVISLRCYKSFRAAEQRVKTVGANTPASVFSTRPGTIYTPANDCRSCLCRNRYYRNYLCAGHIQQQRTKTAEPRRQNIRAARVLGKIFH